MTPGAQSRGIAIRLITNLRNYLISMPNQNLFQSLEQRLFRMNRVFLLSVVLPTMLAIIYYSLFASDVYISESHFVIRSSQRQSPSIGLGALLQGTGLSHSLEDANTVNDFMLSRDALSRLNEHLDLARSFSSSKVDRISRFGGLDWDTSFEALHRYYKKKVTIDLEAASSIATLEVRAFTAADAHQINAMLLDMGEALVNKLNERARQDMIRFAAAEVAQAEAQAKAAGLALASYRTRKGVFDPTLQSRLQLQQVTKLQEELIAGKTQYAQILYVSPHNPQIQVLKKRIETLQGEMEAETAKVLASADGSLSKKAVEYERLVLENIFAEKQLAAAMASLEQARNEAQRQQLYLACIVQPSKPDVAVEPRSLRNVLATFALGMITWGVLTILIAGVREHYA
jgi:capsular polysaccharide transport system permease protein